ncbi:aspartate dehydrogenase domain-containing protein [Vineibacter terrae]|uniref:aspartate dehydrogenase domain-containing protein n=1 Tax=Vineibacter terrae TaxID=2586908 RepID=UPI002E36DC28|nr:aspartate dehydrogenase domain-containing protein [Vineibacter terrae]HEX2891870.1 aspartate dehydrogenase domain-containing protein [Vineibacter terrae]
MPIVALVGLGRIGGVIADVLDAGTIPALTLAGRVRRATPEAARMAALDAADIVVEAAAADVVPELARAVLPRGKTLVVTSVSGLWREPGLDRLGGRIIVPSGATLALDALKALAFHDLRRVKACLRLPAIHAPGEVDDYRGTARDAARRFPGHANNFVAAALALGVDDFPVEVQRDETVEGPTVELDVETDTAVLSARLSHRASPDHPEVSRNIALSVLAALRGLASPLQVGV